MLWGEHSDTFCYWVALKKLWLVIWLSQNMNDFFCNALNNIYKPALNVSSFKLCMTFCILSSVTKPTDSLVYIFYSMFAAIISNAFYDLTSGLKIIGTVKRADPSARRNCMAQRDMTQLDPFPHRGTESSLMHERRCRTRQVSGTITDIDQSATTLNFCHCWSEQHWSSHYMDATWHKPSALNIADQTHPDDIVPTYSTVHTATSEKLIKNMRI